MGQSLCFILWSEVISMSSGIFDPYYVASVLADLLGRQRGREVTIELTPKEPPAETPSSNAGG